MQEIEMCYDDEDDNDSGDDDNDDCDDLLILYYLFLHLNFNFSSNELKKFWKEDDKFFTSRRSRKRR